MIAKDVHIVHLRITKPRHLLLHCTEISQELMFKPQIVHKHNLFLRITNSNTLRLELNSQQGEFTVFHDNKTSLNYLERKVTRRKEQVPI